MANFRIQVKRGKNWKWGLNSYTYEQVVKRQAELELIGIKCRIGDFSEVLK